MLLRDSVTPRLQNRKYQSELKCLPYLSAFNLIFIINHYPVKVGGKPFVDLGGDQIFPSHIPNIQFLEW